MGFFFDDPEPLPESAFRDQKYSARLYCACQLAYSPHEIDELPDVVVEAVIDVLSDVISRDGTLDFSSKVSSAVVARLAKDLLSAHKYEEQKRQRIKAIGMQFRTPSPAKAGSNE